MIQLANYGFRKDRFSPVPGGRLTFWGTENPLPISVFTYYSFRVKLSSFPGKLASRNSVGKNDDKVGNKTKKENKKEGSK